MKKNIRLLLALGGALGLIACNSGGDGGGDTPGPGPGPDPDPNPPVESLQPLVFTTLGQPLNLDKIGGTKIWYMKVTNPNSVSVKIFNNSPITEETFQEPDVASGNYNDYLVHPMEFTESYNGEQGDFVDCSRINKPGDFVLNSKSSCVYKFKVYWNSNLNLPQNQNIQINYEFKSLNNPNERYCTSDIDDGIICDHRIPFNQNNTLSYQSISIQSNQNVESMLGSVNGQFQFSMNGNKVMNWVQSSDPEITQNVFIREVIYNQSNNSLTLNNQQVLSGINGSYNYNPYIAKNGENVGASNIVNNTTSVGNYHNVIGTLGNIYSRIGFTDIVVSQNGNFTNSSDYQIVNNAWVNTTDYINYGVDEANNRAMLYKILENKNYCYNFNNGVYTLANLTNNSDDKGWFSKNVIEQKLRNVNGKVYTNTHGVIGLTQRGTSKVSTTANYDFMREFDMINCNIKNSDNALYSFYDFPINTNSNYSVIKLFNNQYYLVPNSQLNLN
ncbi:MAG: hypothetical protein EKK64_01380 [Neisseriaceae bacterium]|nr:MAG: hypothetical protein EKK64_01380 [Neisseriaceae bacterium]